MSISSAVGGQILARHDHKAAIGATTLAEAPICICAFFAYLIGKTVTEIQPPIFQIPFAEFLHHMFHQKCSIGRSYLPC